MMAEPRYRVSLFARADRPQARVVRDVRWRSLRRWLRSYAWRGESPPKHDDALWAPARLRDGYRDGEHVVGISLLVFDCDKGSPIDSARAACAGDLAIIHTTARHTAECPRYRIVLAISREVAPADYARLWRAGAAQLAAAKVMVDKQASDASRQWFVPPAGAEVIELPGSPLDVALGLAAAPHPAATAEVLGGNSRTTSYGVAATMGECAEVAATAPGSRNNRLHLGAWRLGQLIAGGELGESEAIAALDAAARRCGLPPREAAATIRSGMRAGAREPRHAPERREADRPAVVAEVVAPADEGAPAAPSPLAAAWQSMPAEWLSHRPAPRRWLLRHRSDGEAPGAGMLPRGVVGLLSASGGSGKTMALVGLAVAVATGRPWLGHYEVAEPGRVVLALGEEDEAECRRRVWRACRALSLDTAARELVRQRVVVLPLRGADVTLAAVSPARRVVATATHGELRRLLAEHAGADGWALVGLDPLARFGGDVEGDNAVATGAVELLEQLSEAPGGPTVLVAHHSSKLSRRMGEADARGVTALTDGPRWAATLTGTDDGATFAITKNNYAPPSEPLELVRGADGMLRAPLPAEVANRERRRQAAVAERAAELAEADLSALVDVLAAQGGEWRGGADELVRLAGVPRARGRAAVALGMSGGRLRADGSTRNRRLLVGEVSP